MWHDLALFVLGMIGGGLSVAAGYRLSEIKKLREQRPKKDSSRICQTHAVVDCHRCKEIS